jgi:hypothetical protein
MARIHPAHLKSKFFIHPAQAAGRRMSTENKIKKSAHQQSGKKRMRKTERKVIKKCYDHLVAAASSRSHKAFGGSMANERESLAREVQE